ncbi:MAG: geranylgeranylglyceryl/heptaprenylglyceryl phosphate synthase [Ignavibacteriaceae bacterium]|nr:geranylgeranylglyceryl/heptaprenylglyceryl phosphate synthase [Ignavibacteriaceae bacterium]
MSVKSSLNTIKQKRGGVYLVLVDPDKLPVDQIAGFTAICEKSGVDGLLIGGSLLFNSDLNLFLTTIKKSTSLPAILFPGAISQVSPEADAILYISIISGRNADHLIGKHVLAAPMIKRFNLETISTGYMLIDSGEKTTAEYMSTSMPIPRNKPEIAAATALAAKYLGMEYVYLEAGSGAKLHVPFEMVKAVSSYSGIPVITGGGIREPEIARKMIQAGASVVVTGNYFENVDNWKRLEEFAKAVHINE